MEGKEQDRCLCLKNPFRAPNLWEEEGRKKNSQNKSFKWNYWSIFQDVKTIGTFQWNIQNFAEKDTKESNWLLIITGKQAPVCWLRACASAENCFLFWAKGWTVIVHFVGTICLQSYNFQWIIRITGTHLVEALTRVTKCLVLYRIFPFSKNTCWWCLCTQRTGMQRPGCLVGVAIRNYSCSTSRMALVSAHNPPMRH